jgi:hypothetical protein
VTATLTGPAPLVSLTDHVHRDVRVARDARAGRFTHAGVTLDLGRRPDWRHDGLTGDDEWRIEWVKLYEGLDLAHAFSVTGDASFLATWEDLVDSFCDQVPVGWDTSDVSARRVQNWLQAWQRFAHAPAFAALRPGLAERLTDRLLADADHVAAHLTAERNHRTLELYSLLLVALAFGPDGARAGSVLELLAENAATDIWDDGVHRECSTDYHLIVLRSFVGAIANARAAGIEAPAELVARAHLACDFALHVQRPDGTTPALSDGDPDDFRELLTHAGRILDRPDLTWAATGGTAGTPPVARLVSFPAGGYHVQRSGWGDGPRPYRQERFCIVDCGPLGDGGHGHYDQLSVEVAAGGRALLVDPGRYSYAAGTDEARAWRRAFKGTAAHNTVCVDGLDQTPFRPGKPNGPTSRARLVRRHTMEGLDVVIGEVRSPSYDAVHTRVVAFVDDDRWLVHDRLRATMPHRYEARWHLAPEALGRTVVDRERRGQVTIHAPGVVLAVPVWCGDVELVDGWVSPAYGVKVPAPVVVIRVDGRADADIVTAIVPGDDAPDVVARLDGDLATVDLSIGGGPSRRTWWRLGEAGRAGWEQLR